MWSTQGSILAISVLFREDLSYLLGEMGMLSCTVKGFMTASWALPFALDPVLIIGHHCIQQTNKQYYNNNTLLVTLDIALV